MQLSIDDEARRQRKLEAVQANLNRIGDLIKELKKYLRKFDQGLADGTERSPLAREERAALVERINFLIAQVDDLCKENGLPPPKWRKGVDVE